MGDPYDLQRFLNAQDRVFDRVRAELAVGHKRSHWMWFVFPQLRGLGSSSTAQRYAISGRDEAVAYAAHPILGPRLRECTQLVNEVAGRSIHDIFGYPDDLKFHSSMTLFAACAPQEPCYAAALTKHFASQPDVRTLELLEGG